MPLSKIKTGSIATSVTLTSPTITTPTISSLSSASATALTLQSAGTTAVTIDTSQNVLIATTNAITGITGVQLTASNTSENPAYINIFRDDTTIGSGQFLGYLQFCGRDATSSLGTGHAYVAAVAEADHGAGDNATAITFGTTPDNSSTMAERMRIDSSGSVLINKTSRQADEGLGITGKTGSQCAVLVSPISGDYDMINFRNTNGQVGRIGCNGSATSYITSSDYRLKENIAPMTGALAKVAQLKPVTYKWKIDSTDGEGFIAHELAEVCPSAVSGEKDAVDKNGDIQPQGVDTSFLVATLTAAIQELKAINDTQAATITALTARIDTQAADIAELKTKVA